eukprot:TRINITY_DN55257_c0_g1_i1.p1 TRINITY_DN55257_c0_g1~~TRINITY_DN55257_c0_g1_i1.p1  ORF type:complete len:357 (+),score=119.49 TRINITY_DN55257_c0_g1_i1:59-1072(+)
MAPVEDVTDCRPCDNFSPMKGPKGKVLPGSAEELHDLANDAVKRGDMAQATHFYTMAIDVLTRGMKRDADGIAANEDVVERNKASEGRLAKLLANRSFTHLKQGDVAAAIEDAETCTRADPAFEKGHIRLVVALETSAAPVARRLEACERGLESCVDSELLVKMKWRLKKALAAESATPSTTAPAAPADDSEASRLALARKLADGPAEDPRRAAAAADLGSLLAVGSHGVAKDVGAAERYLRIGAEGGEVTAQRNLGLLLLELGRCGEAAELLSAAARAGDVQAEEVMRQLAAEAKAKQAEAREKLEAMAARGELDERATALLEELRAQAREEGEDA